MQVEVEAKLRADTGKGGARKARLQGLVPAVVYGIGIESMAIAVNRKEIHRALSTEAGRNALVELKIEGRKKPLLVLPREIQKDPINDSYLHLDFLVVRRDTKIHTEVPVVLEGKSPAVTKGMVIETHLTSVQVQCFPGAVPTNLVAPAEVLENPGDLIKAKDIVLPDGVDLLTDPEEVVASLALPPAIAAAGTEEKELPAGGAPETGAQRDEEPSPSSE